MTGYTINATYTGWINVTYTGWDSPMWHPAYINQLVSLAKDFEQLGAISVKDLKGYCRRRKYVWPRQAFMAKARRLGKSYSVIADFLRRDHTTVIHGERAHYARLAAGDVNEWGVT